MSKLIKCVALLTVLVMLFGCTGNRSEEETSATTGRDSTTAASDTSVTQSDKPVFMLGELPDIGKYEQNSLEKHDRWYKDFTPVPKANSSYGMLVPFAASYKNFVLASAEDYDGDPYMKDYSQDGMKYGLATVGGKIIADAVFDNVFKHDSEDSDDWFYILNNGGGEGGSSEPFYVMARDGSWVICESSGGSIYSVSDGVITVCRYDYTEGTSLSHYTAYDFSGKKLFEKDINGDLCRFSCGYAEVYDYTDDGSDNNNSYYLNKKGEAVFERYSTVESFCNFRAVVSFTNSFTGRRYGVINTDGDWVMKPVYENIFSIEGKYFIVPAGDTATVYDENGQKLYTKNFCTDSFYPCEIAQCGTEEQCFFSTYTYNDGDEQTKYYHAESGEIMVCGENGAAAQGMADDYFYCTADGTGYLFDANGKTVFRVAGMESAECIVNGCVAVKTHDEDSGKRTFAIYEIKTNKLLFSEKTDNADAWAIDAGNGKVISAEVYSEDGAVYKNLYFDTRIKSVIENAKHIEGWIIDGKSYTLTCTDTFATLTDGSGRVLVRYLINADA